MKSWNLRKAFKRTPFLKRKASWYALVLFALALGAYMLWGSGLKLGSASVSVVPKDHRFGSSIVKTALSDKAASTAFNFMKDFYQDKNLPVTVSLLLQTKSSGSQDNEYAGGWLKEGRLLNMLYVASANQDQPKYLRAWYLVPDNTMSLEKAQDLVKSVFTAKAVDLSGGLVCQNSVVKDKPVTVCTVLASQANGDKDGVLVRNGVPTPSGADGVVVSVCRYPKDSELNSTAEYCN